MCVILGGVYSHTVVDKREAVWFCQPLTLKDQTQILLISTDMCTGPFHFFITGSKYVLHENMPVTMVVVKTNKNYVTSIHVRPLDGIRTTWVDQ